MSVDQLLHLAREDVEAGDEHHVLLAVGDEHEAVLVDMADVARVDEAIADSLRGFLRSIAVSRHHVRAANSQLALLARRQHAQPSLQVDDLHVAAGYGLSDRAWPNARLGGCGADRGHFRHAIALIDLEPRSMPPAFHELNRERCAARGAHPEGRKIGAAQVAGRQQPGINRRLPDASA